jgi:hypothetical protein
MMISVRIAGLERLTRDIVDQAISRAQDLVDTLPADSQQATDPVEPAPPVEPPPPNEHMRPTRRPEP